jgi:hypothetical protein
LLEMLKRESTEVFVGTIKFGEKVNEEKELE